MSQKFENMLNLALETNEREREKTDNLNVGFRTLARVWEIIVKYHGDISFLESRGISVEQLIAGYAILSVPEDMVEELALIEEIEYAEKPKRYYFGNELPIENSCILPVTLGEESLTGEGCIIAVLDSGERVIIMSS